MLLVCNEPSKCSETNLYILETNNSYSTLSFWQARVLRWLHLEFFLGSINCLNESLLEKISSKIDTLAKKTLAAQESSFKEFSSCVQLASCLHKVTKESTLLTNTRARLQELIQQTYEKREKDTAKEADWNALYGEALAYNFLNQVLESDTDKKKRCEEVCKSVENLTNSDEKEILETFFKRVQKERPSAIIHEIADQYQKKWEAPLFILESRNNFYSISPWKAKCIRWLHLEMFIGNVYNSDEGNLRNIAFKLYQLQERIRARTNFGFTFEEFNSLCKVLTYVQNIKRTSPTRSSIQARIFNLGEFYFFNRIISNNDDALWKAKYAFMLACEFSIKQYTSAAEIEHACSEFCEDIQKKAPNEWWDIAELFFAHLEKEYTGDFLQSIKKLAQEYEIKNLKETKVNAFYFFQKEQENATPTEIATWFQKELETLPADKKQYHSEIIKHLLQIMRVFLAQWKFRVILQSYGVFISKHCRDAVIEEFESIAENCRPIFSPPELLYVLDGLVERKGGAYCRKIAASLLESGDIRKAFIEYAAKARIYFGPVSRDVILKVLQEIFEKKVQDPEKLAKEIALEFISLAKKEESYEILTPLLGTRVTVRVKVAPQAVAQSLIVSSHRKVNSQVNLFSFLRADSPLSEKEPSFTEKIEFHIVSALAGEKEFRIFYGKILGSKIITKARIKKDVSYQATLSENADLYRKLLLDKAYEYSEDIIDEMEQQVKGDLLAEADKLLSDPLSGDSSRKFSEMHAKIQQCPLEFSNASEKIAENFIESFLKICLEEKEREPIRPSLSFVYSTLPLLTEGYSLAIDILGLQSEGSKIFLSLFHKHNNAKEVIEWIENAKEYYNTFPETQFFFLLSNTSNFIPKEWASEKPEDAFLLTKWFKNFYNAAAVEKSIFRGGAESISIQGAPLQLEKNPSSHMIGSCYVAEALLKLVEGPITDHHMRAIGILLTVATIDYDPGSTIPNSLWAFQRHIMGEGSPVIFGSPLYSAKGDSQDASIKSLKTVFSFGFEKNKYFYVERCYRYPKYCEERLVSWTIIQTKLSVDILNTRLINVTYSSRTQDAL